MTLSDNVLGNLGQYKVQKKHMAVLNLLTLTKSKYTETLRFLGASLSGNYRTSIHCSSYISIQLFVC